VYLSIFGADDRTQTKTFIAIEHAGSRIQSLLAGRLRSKFCPTLRFHRDQQFKKTLEIMKLIDQTVDEQKEKDSLL